MFLEKRWEGRDCSGSEWAVIPGPTISEWVLLGPKTSEWAVPGPKTSEWALGRYCVQYSFWNLLSKCDKNNLKLRMKTESVTDEADANVPR